MKLSKVARAGLVVSLIVVSTITCNTASAQLSTSGTGPYYATPSWDQKVTTGRFVVLSNWNNEAVLDRETGLVWQRTAGVENRTWTLALQDCHYAPTGGRTGWRLPSIHEIRSLVDATIIDVISLPAGHPFIVGPTGFFGRLYWSGTTVAQFPTSAYATGVGVSDGISSLGKEQQQVSVWCVRGGGPIGVQ